MKRRHLLALTFSLAGMALVACNSDTISGVVGGGDQSGVTRCESNDDCTDAKRPICSSKGVCIADKTKPECVTNDDCENADKPECSDVGTCVAKGTKLECKSDVDCENADKPVCSVVGTCVAKGFEPDCRADADCVDSDKPVCSAVGTCVAKGTKLECSRDADCESADRPVCSMVGTCIARGAKLECTKNDDCTDPKKNVCNEAGKCVAPGSDVKCKRSEDCKEGQYCSGGVCIDEVDCSMLDSDNDTIADIYEGRNFEDDSQSLDTDGDGVPDYLDLDSDGDTIPDSIEGGTSGCSGAVPVDSDSDGEPDFQDSDSDGNGIPDSFEGCRNADFAYNAETGKWPEPKDVYPDFKKNPELICNKPIDSDGDGVPDFQDIDNDGDNLTDTEEISGVSFSAGEIERGTFFVNCDGNGKREIPLGTPAAPIDCDGDTVPDYMDTDSDGDTIPDIVEGKQNKTGVYARYSVDADGDAIPDSYEGCHLEELFIQADGTWPKPDKNNPAHICKDPVDTDGDSHHDYIDLDSDGDGLPDAFEFANRHQGYNYLLKDSDNDGADDLVEFGAGTNPGDKEDNPKTRGNFVFLAPYDKETTPHRETLSFETAIQTIDLFFVFDHTGSMGEEIQSLKSALKEIINDLQCKDLGKACSDNIDCSTLPNSICSEQGRCITSPQYGAGCFDNMWTGLGYYSHANTFWVAAQLSPDSSKTVTMMDRTFNGWGFCSYGNDEVPYQAPICAVLGTKEYNGKQLCYNWGSNTCLTASCSPKSECKMNCSNDPNRLGCAGFRKDAIRIYVQAFDEEECSNGTSKANCAAYQSNVGPILKENKVKFIGLYSDESTTYKDYANDNRKQNVDMSYVAEYIGKASGTVDKNGKPFAYKAADGAVAENAKAGIRAISKNMPIQITTEVVDIDPGASKLVEKLELNMSEQTVHNRICTKLDASKVVIQNYPMINDLMPGTSVCFDVIPVQNQKVIKPASEPKVYKARVNVLGDGSVLNSGIAYFLVPGEIEQEIVN